MSTDKTRRIRELLGVRDLAGASLILAALSETCTMISQAPGGSAECESFTHDFGEVVTRYTKGDPAMLAVIYQPDVSDEIDPEPRPHDELFVPDDMAALELMALMLRGAGVLGQFTIFGSGIVNEELMLHLLPNEI